MYVHTSRAASGGGFGKRLATREGNHHARGEHKACSKWKDIEKDLKDVSFNETNEKKNLKLSVARFCTGSDFLPRFSNCHLRYGRTDGHI